METILLASGSPRRLEYFRLLGLPFTAVPADIDETPRPGAAPGEVASANARAKAEAARAKAPEAPWICAADTLVAVDGRIRGKCASREAARAVLTELSGRSHQVYTAVALWNGVRQTMDCRVVQSDVTFAPLSPGQIDWYLDSGEWEGAAGAYRAQGIGGCLISRINGSFSSIVGLPLYEFCDMLRNNGYPFGAG